MQSTKFEFVTASRSTVLQTIRGVNGCVHAIFWTTRDLDLPRLRDEWIDKGAIMTGD
jgi:hypothetical protein